MIYVFDATSVWNAKKQCSEQKCVYIDKKDSEIGKFIPNKKYHKLYNEDGTQKPQEELPPPVHVLSSFEYGNIYLMQGAADITGLSSVLKDCFPKQWEAILSCAMQCCSEEEALYLCKPWAENSFGISAPFSQRISGLLKELDEDSWMPFYKKWAALRAEKEYLALDITSISLWSELIRYVEPGYNMDHE